MGHRTEWLQLFQLVERQCQEQIDAQQEQFKHQLELIRKEIKHLAQLKGSSSSWNCRSGDSMLAQTGDALPSSSHAGQLSKDEQGEGTSSAFHLFGQPDIQNRAFITQENFQESTSISSGYGTLSASEPIACLSSYSQNTSGKANLSTHQSFVEGRTEATRLPHLKHIPVNNERTFMLQKSTEGNHANCENTNQPNGKSLTTWAQKLRQNQQKKSVQTDQISPSQSNPHSEQDFDNTDGSSNIFYLNHRTESANSLFSAGSGFTYWMLDEKDMYHPLPDNFPTGVSKLLQVKEPMEARIPSLKDIYYQKQKEFGSCSAWEPLPSYENIHPPEVLTLDPTLHKKYPHDASSCNESYADSIVENSSIKQYDEESLSTASSLLGDSPHRSPHSPIAGVEQWKSSKSLMRRNVNSQSCQGDYERMNCTEDDANSLTLSSSVPQSPVPVSEGNMPDTSGVPSVDHPVILSNIRRSLREKHARHLADLRDYYESEISSLKQQFADSNKCTTSEDLININSLTERCTCMEAALTEASKRIQILENKNNELEKLVAEWKERYHTASNTSKDLQEQIEEMRTRSKEKENAISRLQSRLKEVEESFERAFKQSDDKDEQIKQEHKMFQDLLVEYDSLGKEHERVKDTLGITENKLCDSQTEVNELKRTVLKLEAQIKQLEHEHIRKLRHAAEQQPWSSGANKEKSCTTGNHYTRSPTHWKSLASGTERSTFTGYSDDNKAKETEKQSYKAMEHHCESLYLPNRYYSSTEKDALNHYVAAKPKTEDNSTRESPILKALRDFEEEKGLKSWNKENSFHGIPSKKQTVGCGDCYTPQSSPEKNKERHKHLNSPVGPRSSSLPPSTRKTVSTPTKRELMLCPLQVKYSPKRSPSENLSPGLSELLSGEENTMTRFDVAWFDSSKDKVSSPRKRLQFNALEDSEERKKTINNAESSSISQLPLLMPPYETEITYNERMKNIADTERLFDELSEEKKQIEAALSRMPSAGRRMSLQTRAMKENLEDRLEKINRDLGSIRMTLKKYHVLPTSANI
ncbi:M-phase phosphoprotein 9 [Gastrophryne carolinensis]